MSRIRILALAAMSLLALPLASAHAQVGVGVVFASWPEGPIGLGRFSDDFISFTALTSIPPDTNNFVWEVC